MKKLLTAILLVVTLASSVFAAPKAKVDSFTFDFSKDFYPGMGY